ncbi:anti-sigma factor antagonist [Streptomyces carminius]|uniref:Anti-sigma factor antagonist n=1 Tax=Streptomyces carminius TaxID=2665496 RepID=A0A2M8M619_9ACTN|nr:STAS domain-containing protein [Streptomyces carminius]PJE99628.1 anti-sigma factor antagonist [Streptomyces carminius]
MRTLSVAVSHNQGTVVLRPHGDVDQDNAPTLTGALEKLEQPCRSLAVDLSQVPFMDSAGLHALLFLERRCRARGARLILTGVRDQPARLLDLVGLTGHFSIIR